MRLIHHRPGPKARPRMHFEIGRIMATPGALQAMERSNCSLAELLHRHRNCDWGDVSPGDAKLNDAAVRDGARILSAYQIGNIKIWLITEADRSVTTFLLPTEY